MIYPSVKHQIPDLFKVIIKSDEAQNLLKQLPVIDFQQYKENKEERARFSQAAANFLKRQRGGNNYA